LKNHVAWPHYGPGNKGSKEIRYVAFFAFALDERARRHTTSERVYHSHTFRTNECYQYENPVGEEKMAFTMGGSVASLRLASQFVNAEAADASLRAAVSLVDMESSFND
jgi:hypothetical protein